MNLYFHKIKNQYYNYSEIVSVYKTDAKNKEF